MVITPEPLDAVEDFINTLPRAVEDISKEISSELEAPLLAELQKYPSRPSYAYGEFPWKTERQRRYVMAKLKGRRSRRSGKLRKGWRVSITGERGKLIFLVVNTEAYAQFVVGRFNQKSRDDAVMPIQPFHAPRWKPAVDIVKPYFVKADAAFAAAITKRFDAAVQTRARRRSSYR